MSASHEVSSSTYPSRAHTPAAAAAAHARRIVVATLWLLPLVVWPGLARPFSTPKLWVVALAAVALLALARRVSDRDGRHAVPAGLTPIALCWMASFALAATFGPLPSLPHVVLGLAAPTFALGLVRSTASASRVVGVLVGAATIVAAVALLQWAGVDPLAWFGWQAPVDGLSVRMRVHATLGNPNFVGALMALTVPLAVARLIDGTGAPSSTSGLARAGVWRSAATLSSLVCLTGAVLATGSRGAVLGLAAAGLVWAVLRGARRAVAGAAVVLMFGAVAIVASPARSLETTLAGRVYLWRVVAPHAAAHPVVGYGPGAVALRFPAWQREADVRGVQDPRFRGLTDHVHNDYLEALVERGVVGLLTLLLPIAAVAARVWRCRPCPPLVAGAAASVAAGAACALVDFPLARPVEVVWWWTAVALVHMAMPRGSSAGA